MVCQGLLICQRARVWGGGSDSVQLRRSAALNKHQPQEKKHERSLSHSDPPAQLTDIHLALFHPYFDPRLSGKLSNPEEDGEVRI